jgi:hypothetical protein
MDDTSQVQHVACSHWIEALLCKPRTLLLSYSRKVQSNILSKSFKSAILVLQKSGFLSCPGTPPPIFPPPCICTVTEVYETSPPCIFPPSCKDLSNRLFINFFMVGMKKGKITILWVVCSCSGSTTWKVHKANRWEFTPGEKRIGRSIWWKIPNSYVRILCLVNSMECDHLDVVGRLIPSMMVTKISHNTPTWTPKLDDQTWPPKTWQECMCLICLPCSCFHLQQLFTSNFILLWCQYFLLISWR